MLLPALLVGSVGRAGRDGSVMRRSILTEKLARRGHHIAREYSIDLFELARVSDVMDKRHSVDSGENTVAALFSADRKWRPTGVHQASEFPWR